LHYLTLHDSLTSPHTSLPHSFSSSYPDHRHLHSFPTRRSSDLATCRSKPRQREILRDRHQEPGIGRHHELDRFLLDPAQRVENRLHHHTPLNAISPQVLWVVDRRTEEQGGLLGQRVILAVYRRRR